MFNKIKLLFLGLTLIANCTFSQVATFRQFNEPYKDLKNDDAPFVNFKWGDSFSFSIYLTDTIIFDTLQLSHLLIQGNGYASLSKPFDIDDPHLIVVPLFVTNLVDRSLKINSAKAISPISYKYDWFNGEKVLKVQWKNVGFQYGSPNDSANFQLWLFTQSQKVQYRYGKSFIANLDSIVKVDSMQIGIEIYSDVIDKSTLLSGTPSNFVLSTDYNAAYFGIPPEGTVYEFTSLSLGFNNVKPGKINYKIEHDQLIVLNHSSNLLRLELINLLGNKVASTNSNTISINDLNSGIYVLSVETLTGIFTQKVFISK